jgi:hypothetical protein
MKTFLLFALLLCISTSYSQEYSRAKIYTDNRGLQALAEIGIAADHGTIKEDTYIISDFSSREIQLAEQAGFTVEILIEDVQKFYREQNKGNNSPAPEKNIGCPETGAGTFNPEIPSNFQHGSMGGFYTYQEFLNELDSMASKFPDLITSRAAISTFLSHEGRPLYWMRLSDNPEMDENEPEVLYTALHHAREANSLSEVIFYMWYLLENYETSDEIKYLVDNTEMYFVPMVNPDGYIYNENTAPLGGGMWRKNRRDNGDGTFGVDLNRNYDSNWGTAGISMDPSSDVYPGTGPFSEPETQAMKWFCENRDFQYASNAHTFGGLLLFPYGNDENHFAENHEYYDAYTHHMVKYNHYTAEKSTGLYPTSGGSDDYMYGTDLIVKPKIFATTPEVSNTNGGFWPAENEIDGICKEMVFTNLMIAHLTHKYLAVEDTDPAGISSTTGNFNHSVLKLGLEAGPVNVTITPLQGISGIGTGVSYDLDTLETAIGSISYTLDAGIQIGDPIQYLLNTDYGSWIKHDTINKVFGNSTPQILDEANNANNWTGDWSTTTSDYVSPSQSFTDSPDDIYPPNSETVYTFNQPVDLTNATSAAVKFYAKWDIENGYDYCQFQVSQDNGITWQGQCGIYTNEGTSWGIQPAGEPVYDDVQATWVQEQIDLGDYLGSQVRLRFLLLSDNGVETDGFYFDDFEVSYEEENGLDANQLSGAFVLPNPANNKVTVNLPMAEKTLSVTVIDANGKLVHSQVSTPANDQMEFSVSDWNEGIYFIHLTTGENTFAPLKLVVIH